MSRWFYPLLIAAFCAQTAFATPAEPPADAPTAQATPLQAGDAGPATAPAMHESLVRRSFEQVGHTIELRCHVGIVDCHISTSTLGENRAVVAY